MTWRRAIAAAVAAAFCLVALVVVFRSDGLPSVDAASSRATHWFVHQPSGRVVLADGYGGRALARLEVGSPGSQLSIAEGPTGAFVINDDTNEVRAIDTAELRLGPPVGLASLGAGGAISGVGANGLVVADPTTGDASLLQTSGEQATFGVPSTPVDDVQIAPDGAIWSVDGDQLVRTTSVASTREQIGAANVELSLVGNRAFLLDRDGRRARLGNGSWQPIPTTVDPSELVVQVPGPPNDCGWVGAGDQLWCVGETGIGDRSTVEGLGISGSDILAIAGSAAALVHRGPSAIVRFDWRSHEILDTEQALIDADEPLQVTATVDLIWIDETAGDFVWGVHPWGIEPILKNDDTTLLVGETGEVIDEGDASQNPPGVDDNQSDVTDRREPDNNGIDDPPVAVDDVVTARSGTAVPVEVTANDYDPDGEAVAVVAVDEPDNGTVDIGTASTVVYNPDPGFVGVDQFDYTITDGDGTEATATVTVELLPSDAANQAPIGTKDRADTGAGVAVVVDVLANDIDPERDALRLDSFDQPSQADQVGTVSETVGPRGLPALRFDPAPAFQGTAVFGYRPADVLGATGAEVEVLVEVAGPGAENRPPYAAPDAIRVRRGVSAKVPVLVNDVDADGDRLTVSLVEPLPDRLTVEVRGEDLQVTAGVGSADLLPFQYEIDDSAGHKARTWVLVAVIGDVEPNQPPVVTADTGTVVAGNTVTLDVLANDSDADGDPLTVIEVTQPSEGGRAVALNDGVNFVASERSGDERINARFMYTVSDGNGHEVSGQVNVAILPERLSEPPFARDDSTFTFVDTPVTIDVLRNDGDPSGERPSLAGSPGCPGGGEAEVTPDNLVRFTPPPGQSGSFRCSYEVTNSQGLRAGAEIIVSVREPERGNEPPLAMPDRLNVKVGETASVTVTANDSDPDGDRSDLRVISITPPRVGEATHSATAITYTAPGTPGEATIRYTIEDADGATASSTVQIFIADEDAVKQAPVANGAQREVEAPATPVVFDVSSLIDDPDGSPDELEVTGVQKASEAGTASWVGFTITVTPPSSADFTGVVAARYTIEDADGLTASAVLTVKVVAPQNRPPEAKDDQLQVANSSSGRVNVLANDTDPDGDPLTVSITSAPDPAIGTASVSGGTISFTAKKGASGPATVGYTVSDGELSDMAVVRVTVLPCTDSVPVAKDAFLETGYQQPINISLSSYVTNGTVTGSSGPPGWIDPVYTPPAGENGNVTITYTVANGCADTTTGTITIDVNQSPVPQAQALSLGKNESRTIPVANLAGDDEPLVITGSTGAPSWVTTTPGSLVIAPPPGTVGTTFSWTTTVQDPGGLTAAVPVSVSVSNLPPVAVNDLVDASATTGPFTIVANDSDPDDPNASLFVSSIPAVVQMEVGTASVTLLSDGRRILIDTSNGQGRGGFYYTVSDPSGATSTAIVGFYGPPIPPPTTTTTTTTLPPTTTRPTLTIPPPTTAPPTTSPPTTAPAPTTPPATIPNASTPNGSG